MPGSRSAYADARWPEISTALAALRERHRHAVRIVDADCACGTLLIEALRHARVLGFTAIEGRGIDGSPAMISRARAAAARLDEPAVGVAFELADMRAALADEVYFPADIVLWHGRQSEDMTADIAALLAAAGRHIITGASNRTVRDTSHDPT